MEYVRDRGHYADLPFDELIAVFRKYYPMFFKEDDTRSAYSFEKDASQEH